MMMMIPSSMRFPAARLSAAILGSLALLTPVLSGQALPRIGVAFEAPQRIKAADKFMGGGRMYPSPTLQDVNGDGLADLVIGDLPGRVTYAVRLKDTNGQIRFGPEKALKDREGEKLKFHNW